MLRRFLIFLVALAGPALHADSALAEAQRLYLAQNYAEARALLQPLVDREPANAAACHLLGLALRQRGDAGALDAAHPWLEKAAHLAPANAEYLADLAANDLQLAQIHWSYSFAVTGRDLMESALKMDPTDVGGSEGLMRFYREAPWPLGSRERAEALAATIQRLDPRRGALAAIYLQRMAKNYAGALTLALAALTHYPDDYRVLFEVGRNAAQAGVGNQLDAGIAALEKCLRLVPPMDAPDWAEVSYRLGTLWSRKGDLGAARAAFVTALARDPANTSARRALEQLP